MMRNIIFSLYLIIGYALTVNAENMSLESRSISGRELSDGDVIASGKVYCEESDMSWVGLMNIHFGDGVFGNVYILQGKNRAENKLKVRIEGDGWYSSSEVGKGIYKTDRNKNEQFYVVAHGSQYVNPDVYSIKASSICSRSHQDQNILK